MKLLNDVSRCQGVGSDEKGWREGCDNCLRRTDKATSEYVWYMMPPPIIVFECEFRIDPSEELK